jgi:hypothetical protein
MRVYQSVMSEEHSADENERSIESFAGGNDPFNRRRFVKTLGAAGGMSLFGGLGVGQALAVDGDTSADGSAFELRSASLKSQNQALADVNAVQQTAETAKLASVITAESGHEIDTPMPLSVAFQVDDKALNAANPALTTLTLKPTGTTWEDTKVADAGAMFALTVDRKDGGREPAAIVAFTFHEKGNSGRGTIKMYGDAGDGPGIVRTEQVKAPSTKINRRPASQSVQEFTAGYSDSPDVGTNSAFSCGACVTIVNVICFGVSELGRWGCLVQCLKVGAVPTAYAACSALCFALTTVYGRGFCATGAWPACYALDYC